MNILVIGTGYVGLTSGTCFSDFGHSVTCLDVDVEKIEKIHKGILPIYEPGLDSLVSKNIAAGRLKFTTSYDSVKDADVVFLAVGTPPLADGSADLQYVLAAAKELAEHLEKYTVIVNKSTVPIGTGQKVKGVIQSELKKRKANVEFDIVSNPEFLREGVAISDFMKPDRIVIGAETEKAKNIMRSIYTTPYNNNQAFVFTNIETAEMVKYASNAFLATKISFINEISAICEKVGANVKDVAKGMGLDHRINKYSLYAGPGYGGSCFPKDTKALIEIGRSVGEETKIVIAAEQANQRQKERMVEKIEAKLGSLNGCNIAVLGLAFKPETDDVREAPATVIIKGLLKKGVIIRAYDPVAIETAKKFALQGENVYYAKDEFDAAKDCDAIVFVTEWIQFRTLNLKKLAETMKGSLLFDFRNIFEPEEVKEYGFTHIGIGR